MISDQNNHKNVIGLKSLRSLNSPQLPNRYDHHHDHKHIITNINTNTSSLVGDFHKHKHNHKHKDKFTCGQLPLNRGELLFPNQLDPTPLMIMIPFTRTWSLWSLWVLIIIPHLRTFCLINKRTWTQQTDSGMEELVVIITISTNMIVTKIIIQLPDPCPLVLIVERGEISNESHLTSGASTAKGSALRFAVINSNTKISTVQDDNIIIIS